MSIPDLVAEIESSRDEFLDLVGGLTPQEAAAPIGEGRWSPLEYLEHLVRAEEVTIWRMFKAVEDARTSRGVLKSPTPEATIEDIVDRTWEVHEEAPPLAIPKLGASRAYWSIRMSSNAALVSAFADLVEESELDAIAYPHPISGPFTMRQGFEFIRFHLDRHRVHIVEAGIGSP